MRGPMLRRGVELAAGSSDVKPEIRQPNAVRLARAVIKRGGSNVRPFPTRIDPAVIAEETRSVGMEAVMRRVALLLVLLVPAVLGVPSLASAGSAGSPNDTYRIHGTAWTTPTISGTCPAPEPGPPPVVPIEITVEGVAEISRLGWSTVVVEETGIGICVGGPVPVPVAVISAQGTFTAANGDELDFESVESSAIEPVPGTPLFGFTSVDEFTPTGTGRFADATGSVQTVVTFDPTVTPVQAVFTLHGTITIPKP